MTALAIIHVECFFMRIVICFVLIVFYFVVGMCLAEATKSVTDRSDRKAVDFAGIVLVITPYVLSALIYLL